MKVVFNGVLETAKTGGCAVCGKRRVSTNNFVMKKDYILPSGLTKTFLVGKEEEVSDEDGRFLLSYTYQDANGLRKAFEEVK